MADDQSTSGQRQPSERLQELANQHGGMSKGMTSPDSTQAPLRAIDGEPDAQATGGGASGGRGDEPVEDEDGR